MTEPISNLEFPAPAEGPGDLWHGALPRILAAVDRHLGPGDLAELRRLRPEDPGSPAFWRLVATYLDGNLPKGEAARFVAERQWATILRTFAELKGLHAPAVSLGRALAEADFSELRFSRLLRAKDALLDDAVRGASRILASKGQKACLTDFAALVLIQDGEPAEVVRRRLARTYYSKTPTTTPS